MVMITATSLSHRGGAVLANIEVVALLTVVCIVMMGENMMMGMMVMMMSMAFAQHYRQTIGHHYRQVKEQQARC